MDNGSIDTGGVPAGLPPMPSSSIGGVPVVGGGGRPPYGPAGVVSAEAAQKTESVLKFAAIGIGVLLLIAIVLFFWAFSQWQSARADVEGEIAVAVNAAVEAERQAGDDRCAEQMKTPFMTLQSPVEYGPLIIQYPRNWSVFVESNTIGRNYVAYLNYPHVMPLGNDTRHALRVIQYDNIREYDTIIQRYNRLVDRRELSVQSFSVESTSGGVHTGLRYDGQFDKNIRGAAVIFKIRDKTVWLRTDSEEYLEDFNRIVETVTFREDAL